MKVLYLSSTAALGGAERVLLDVIESIRRSRPDWQLALICGENGPLVERAAQAGASTEVLPFPRRIRCFGDFADQTGRCSSIAKLAGSFRCAPGAALYVRRLRDAIARCAPHLIHANGFKMHIFSASGRPRGSSLVWHVHDYVSSRPLMSRLFRLRARHCSAIVANSGSVADDIRHLCQPEIPVHTVLNGIDLQRFSPAGHRINLDAAAGLPPAPPGTVRVGLLATMAKWKGQKVFLNALASLPRTLPVRGYLIGGQIYSTDGSEYDVAELKALAQKIGIKVGFTGFINEPDAVIRALDIVVHASTSPEPFGRVIAEGMACGRPVISSAIGGAAELVVDRENAMVCAPSDAAGLADRIAILAKEPELRARIGRAGRACAEARFDRTRQAAEMVGIYETAAGLSI